MISKSTLDLLSEPFITASGDRKWDLTWIYLYIGAWMIVGGLYWARQAYKSSPKYRQVMRTSGFLSMTNDTPDKDKIAVVLKLFATFPSTVSEMIHDKDSPHGTVFRSIYTLAGLILLKTDITVILPGLKYTWEAYLAHASILASVIGTVGIAMAPSPKGAFSAFKDVVEFKDKKVPDHFYDKWVALDPQNKMHGLAGSMMFMTFMLSLVATLWPCYLFVSTGELSRLSLGGGLWLTITATRLFGIVVGMYTSYVFVSVMYQAIVSDPSKDPHKIIVSFWSEQTLITILGQISVLLAISSWFDFRSTSILQEFHSRSIVGQYGVAAIALLHVYYFLKHFVSAAMLMGFRDVEYTDAKLLGIFKEWRAQEGRSLAAFEKQMAQLLEFANKEE